RGELNLVGHLADSRNWDVTLVTHAVAAPWVLGVVATPFRFGALGWLVVFGLVSRFSGSFGGYGWLV
ncbi:MAG: hypothetical protein WA988_02080, partial [Candidatus Nanopelagicales bacterium]